MTPTLDDVKRFEDWLRREIPDLRVVFKDQSWYHKAIGWLLYPFNPGYMTSFITTMGSAIYYPSKASYEANPAGTLSVLAHEFVHIYDSKHDRFYKLAYLFPQVLAIIPIVLYAILAGASAWILGLLVAGYFAGVYVMKAGRRKTGLAVIGASVITFLVLGILLTKWLALILLGLAVLAPWPAPWRVHYELRGYSMNVGVSEWCKYVMPSDYLDRLVRMFVGPAYCYMSWRRGPIQRHLEATRQQAQQGALNRIKPYSIVYDFLYNHGFVPRNEG